LITLALLFSACSEDSDNNDLIKKETQATIFELLDETQSGITFSNNLKEDSIINYFTYPYNFHQRRYQRIGSFKNEKWHSYYRCYQQSKADNTYVKLSS